MKMIWVVMRPGQEPVATYPYREKAAAEKEKKKRGSNYLLTYAKVPMDDDE